MGISDSEMTSDDILLARLDCPGPMVWISCCAGGIQIRMINFEIFLEMVNIDDSPF